MRGLEVRRQWLPPGVDLPIASARREGRTSLLVIGHIDRGRVDAVIVKHLVTGERPWRWQRRPQRIRGEQGHPFCRRSGGKDSEASDGAFRKISYGPIRRQIILTLRVSERGGHSVRSEPLHDR